MTFQAGILPVTFDPKLDIRHRCRVYKLGVLWLWKCNDFGCKRGGRARMQLAAINRAMKHTTHQGQEDY